MNQPFRNTIRMLIKLNSESLNKDHVTTACDVLTRGGIIAIPTDTLYGLAADAGNPRAVKRIYDIKGRDSEKPLAISIGDIDDINNVACIDHIDTGLLNTLLPGPVTLLFKRGPKLIRDLNPGIANVGVRIPDHDFVRNICRKFGPLALTSSNRSSEPSSLDIDDFRSIWSQIDCIFDGGPLNFDEQRLGSTVVDLSIPTQYRIVRSGCAGSKTEEVLKSFGLSKEI